MEAQETAWRRFSETFTDYGQIFLPVRVEPFDLDTTRDIIGRVAEDLGVLHGVAVTAEAVEQALDLYRRLRRGELSK